MTAPRPSRIHPAWIVLGALTLTMLAASGIRAVFGIYIKPMEAEFGWTRSATSGVAAISLLLVGASGPWFGRLADRSSPRLIITVCLAMLGIGSILSAYISTLWHLYVTAGVFLALGAGGVAMTTGVTLVTRWFEKHRGLALGLAAGGMSAGQLIIVPIATAITVYFGWRSSYLWLGLGLLVLVLPLAAWLIRNSPEERGLTPYGAAPGWKPTSMTDANAVASRVSISEALRYPQFWLLMGTFFVCGYTTFGTVLTHFMPHALEHSFTELQAASALGVMGAMNVLGTVGSGWICDRFGKRGPLATYYFLRGVSLVFLLYVWDVPSLHLWAAIFGLNYISTVPPTTALTGSIFGRYSVGELSGWIFFAHQVGGALGAAFSGWLYELTGSYSIPFFVGGVLGILAAFGALAIRDEPVTARPTSAAAGATA
jgi:MFS family permease